MSALAFPSIFGKEYDKIKLKPGFLTPIPRDFSLFPSLGQDLIM